MLERHNYFKILNIPSTYNIDKEKLKQNYYTQEKRYHPSVTNNTNIKLFDGLKKAYDTLKNYLSRAIHLYECKSANENVNKNYVNKLNLKIIFSLSER